MSDMIRRVALAICKSRTCEGASCCEWPANRGRTKCNAKNGAYDEAAVSAIETMGQPTRDMLLAGENCGLDLTEDGAAEVWHDMIQAALTTGERDNG